MVHHWALKAIESTFAYGEQLSDVTLTGILLIRQWCELVAKKWKEAKKQVPLLISSKNRHSFTNLNYVQYYSFSEIFLFDVWFYLPQNIMINWVIHWVDIHHFLSHYSSLLPKSFSYLTFLQSCLVQIIMSILHKPFSYEMSFHSIFSIFDYRAQNSPQRYQLPN